MAHVHPTGALLIADIIAVSGVASHTAYDILRLPIYKTWDEHNANYQAIIAELNPVACDCVNVAAAITLVNNAWGNINTPPTKAAYDVAVLARPPPVLAVPTFIPSADAFNPEFPRNLGRTWGLEFKNVEGCPKSLIWFKYDPATLQPPPEGGAVAPPRQLFSCYRSNTFWTSLAMGLYGDNYQDGWQYWGHAKQMVRRYYQATIGDPAHPRFPEYPLLNAYSVAKGNFNLNTQLRPNHPIREVSPELWQVVADCFHIELFIISGDRRANGFVPVIPRGDHNTRQVFLRREVDGEYFFVRPDKPDPHEWRYKDHMYPDRVSAPKDARQLSAFNRKSLESGAKRCPYLVTDADGVNIRPHATIPGYTGENKNPPHVLDEMENVPPPTAAQVLAYLNCGQWR